MVINLSLIHISKMQGIEVRADMADGFNPSGKDGGYSFGAALSTYTKRGNKWVFGGESRPEAVPAVLAAEIEAVRHVRPHLDALHLRQTPLGVRLPDVYKRQP